MRVTMLFAAALALGASVFTPALGAQAGDPPSRAARISALVGQASLQAAGAEEWSEAARNFTVTTGDRIFTSADARLELEIGPMSVRLAPGSDVTVTNLSDGLLQLGIGQGTLRLAIYRLPRGDTVEVDTPNGAIVVTRPGDYRIDVLEGDRFTIVRVDAGSLDILGPGIDQQVRSGQAVQLSGTDRIRAISIPLPALGSFDQWGDERNRRIASASCSRYMNRDIPGCADLDESGRWERNADYGDIWYPTGVSIDWVPYRNGRWVWVEPWGWSWMADEPWGYAPFHYGRWARIGPAWGWIPGPVEVRPYYAPALVAFVGGEGWSMGVTIGSQAWFPLGPREAYIPSYHHGDTYLRQVNIANLRNVTNINTIINVQNIDHVNYVNRTAGITAVSTDVFRAGRPVGREALRVGKEQNARGSIVAHPNTAPLPQAERAGRAVVRPRVVERPAMITRGGQRRDPLNPKVNPAASPPVNPTVKPPMNPPVIMTGTPPVNPPGAGDTRGKGRDVQRGGPPNGRGQSPPPVVTPPPSITAPPVPPPSKSDSTANARSRDRKTIITHKEPPPRKPPFKEQEKALKANPGRPLEPQQIDKIKAGLPPGPPKDTENPPRKVAPVPTPVPRGGTPPVPTVKPVVPPAKPVVPTVKGKGRGGKADSAVGRGRGGKVDTTNGRGRGNE